MAMEKKPKKVTARRIFKDNPQIDERFVRESLRIAETSRSLGARRPGFSLLRSSEATLKISPPELYSI
jgi:hypothetical protein